ncbi:hypothetical protein [Telluria aromaticivorans]|uniref:Uncharacterized protein n=1 Tax=Telluria aromaticivorans TaxID=2725995 RepID=A0A7Y2JZ81_9BURK|nr:hypothetical protein [Telluria aromaticivorans]NNG23245.1 hypothetical protein [Telluria aromaticivorans]
MRLPGTRYQEHGWEQVRKLLGQCSLAAFARIDPMLLLEPGRDAGLTEYVDAVAELLGRRGSLGAAPGNSYGDTAHELALTLVYELQARPADWAALCSAVASEHARISAFWAAPGGDAPLRKKFNDLYAVLRDKVDSDNYQAACGRPCSPNRIYAYRMLDTAYGEVARLFASWREHRGQVGAILGRTLDAEPIEARQLRSIAGCRPEWIMRWSETLEAFGGAPGPLHTRSKRFASLKDNPGKIGAMLREIGEYEALSSNQDRDWLQDASDAGAWLDDYWRVLGESESGSTPGPDQILEAQQEELDLADAGEELPAPPAEPLTLLDASLAERVSLPPRYLEMAAAAQERGSWAMRMMAEESLPVRLAVYLKLLGPFDDSYPSDWLDPATGELPTMQQFALLDGVSLPTLRKRRDAAIAKLGASAGVSAAGMEEENRWT